ncbi:AAA family ATPase [bacterium]|nr:AAA family ATPase [bacterium]
MIENIKKNLSILKLAGIAKTFEDRISYANEQQISYVDFLRLLIEEELVSRKNNSLVKRIAKAKIPRLKKIEDFDFKFQPTLNKAQILDLASCSFIEKKENIIFMGNPGTGKTHLSEAIAQKALLKGYTVLFTNTHQLIDELQQSKADGTYYSKLQNYIKPDLLVIDELGYKKFTQNGADDFFEIINQRYENKSIIITSNKTFEDWASILYDPVLASAIIDRLVHHSKVIVIKGESFRAKFFKESVQNFKKE